MKKYIIFLTIILISSSLKIFSQSNVTNAKIKSKNHNVWKQNNNYYKYFENPYFWQYEFYKNYLQLPSMPIFINQPKITGPVAQGGLIDMSLNDNYYTKDTLEFDPSSIPTITDHELIKHYPNATILDIPPRRMWGWGGDSRGYCGETSLQMCGIYFGNWISSEIIRYAANNEELLIGDSTDPNEDNDIQAAQNLKFTYERFSSKYSNKFTEWVKNHIDAGHPIILGWYQYHKPYEEADDDYDHIMPIIGYSIDQSKQINGFYFYDLYLKNYSLIQGSTYQHFINTFFKSRKETKRLTYYKVPNSVGLDSTIDLPGFNSNKKNSNFKMYAFTYAIPKKKIYALAITGIQNKNKTELFRTKLSVNHWHEPDWSIENQLNQKPINLELTATVYELTPGQSYSILRFEPKINKTKGIINTNTIPTSNYNNSPYTQKIDFTAVSSTEKINLGFIQSDKAYFYRTIKQ